MGRHVVERMAAGAAAQSFSSSSAANPAGDDDFAGQSVQYGRQAGATTGFRPPNRPDPENQTKKKYRYAIEHAAADPESEY